MKDLQNIILGYPNVKQWSINSIQVKCSKFGHKLIFFEHVHYR